MSQGSNVGHPSTYEDGNQHHYSASDIQKEGRDHGINTEGYLNKDKIVDELHESDIQDHIKDRMKHDPGYAASMHGNKPSKGAMIDADIAKEESEMLEKKKHNADSMPAKKMEHGT